MPPNPEPAFRRIIAELKRRRVFRVAALYGTVAFVIIQAADIAFPALGVPAWSMTALVLLWIAGFPVTLVLAWMFEVRREGGAPAIAEPGGPSSPMEDGGVVEDLGPTRAGPWVFAVVLACAVAGTGAAIALWRGAGAERPPGADPAVVAVLPFRVSGADPSLRYLREGMVDLLATKLTGEGGPRALAPRTLFGAWRQAVDGPDADLDNEAALGLGRRLGAGQVLLGEVVGRPDALTLSASVFSTATRRPGPRASLSGTADGLFQLVDRLTAELLARSAGYPEQRLEALTSGSLAALRQYLNGQRAYRSGDYAAAGAAFLRALDADTTFSLAALGLYKVAEWTSLPPGTPERAQALAWAARARLGDRDAAHLTVVLGRRYPQPTPWSEALADAEQAVERFPDDPELWYEASDALFHFGALLGIERSLDRAAAGFQRALQLEPTYAEPVPHAVEVALRDGDAPAARTLAEAYLRTDSVGQTADVVRWNLSWATSLMGERARDPSAAVSAELPAATVYNIGYSSLFTGRGIPEAARLIEELHARPATRAQRERTQIFRLLFATLAGRTVAAANISTELAMLEAGQATLRRQVLLDVFGGDDPAAEARADQLRRATPARPPSEPTARGEWYWNTCALSISGLAADMAPETDETIEALHSADAASASGISAEELRVCAHVVEALHAHRNKAEDADLRAAALDSALLTAPRVVPLLLDVGNLVSARIHEERGRTLDALAAVRRRPTYGSAPYLRAAQLREEGRLAAIAGDIEGARAAYTDYLALRYDPDPPLRPERTRVAAELARLQRTESRGARGESGA